MMQFPLCSGQFGLQNPSTQTVPFSHVKYGSNFTGTNGQTSATDFSASARAITFNGNAQIKTDNSTFGAGSSLYLDGAGDYLTLPDSTDWTPGLNQDFCWEFVVIPDGNIAADGDFLSHATGTGSYPYRMQRAAGANGGLRIQMFNSAGLAMFATTAGSIPDSQPSHVYFCRQGTVIYGGIRGKTVITQTGSGDALFNAANTLKIGIYAPPGGQAFKGWIQSARYTLGDCIYPAGLTFEPPTSLFPTS